MKKAIVLTIPHTGTHFTMYLINKVLGGNAVFSHFEPVAESLVTQTLRDFDPSNEVIVLPWRPDADVKVSWFNRTIGPAPRRNRTNTSEEYDKCWDVRDRLVSLLNQCGFMLFPIDKTPMRFQHVDNLRRAMGMGTPISRSDEETKFIGAWTRHKSWDPDAGLFRESPITRDDMKATMIKLKLKEKDSGT